MVVFPDPDGPTIKVDSKRLDSGVFIIFPVSESLHNNISQVYGPNPAFVSDKSIPGQSNIESLISFVSLTTK